MEDRIWVAIHPRGSETRVLATEGAGSTLLKARLVAPIDTTSITTYPHRLANAGQGDDLGDPLEHLGLGDGAVVLLHLLGRMPRDGEGHQVSHLRRPRQVLVRSPHPRGVTRFPSLIAKATSLNGNTSTSNGRSNHGWEGPPVRSMTTAAWNE